MLSPRIKLQRQWQQTVGNDLLITCANCEHWDRDNDQCGLFKSHPPVDVIIIGCDEWEQDIPF